MKTEQALKAKVKRLQEASENHVEAHTPGELRSQDLYLVGHIKGVGKVYLQAAVDCSCSVAFARLSVNKLPIRAYPKTI